MSQDPIRLQGIEGFHVGGHARLLDGFPPGLRFQNNGHHMVGQMYVQFFRVAEPCTSIPLALWHGGGMTGASWENTPDGRPGWLDQFLRAGFSVALCDAFERGRASLPPHPQAFDGVAEYRTLDSIWHHFRFGPELPDPAGFLQDDLRRLAYERQQFPVEHAEQFGRQFVPRFVDSDDEALAAYDAFLERMVRCAVIGHSQGGVFAVRSALARPERIASVVALEPSLGEDCLQRLLEAPDVELPPHLFVFGDFIRDCNATWSAYLRTTELYCEELIRRGVPVRLIELPRCGIRGNSHMLQMDANHLEIAALVEDWLLNALSDRLKARTPTPR